MTRKATFVPDGTADLFDPETMAAQPGRVRRSHSSILSSAFSQR